MPKEWIINQANMRWGLNKKTKVGAVADEIRKCTPKSLKEELKNGSADLVTRNSGRVIRNKSELTNAN